MYNLLFIKIYGIEFYGTMTAVISMSVFFTIFVNFAADKRMVKELYSHHQQIDAYIWASLFWRIQLLLLSLAVFFFFQLEKPELCLFFGWYVLGALYPRGASEYKERIFSQNLIALFEKSICFGIIALNLFTSVFTFLTMTSLLFFVRIVMIIFTYVFLTEIRTIWRGSFRKALVEQIKLLPSNFGITLALLVNAVLIYGQHLHLSYYADKAVVGRVGFAIQLCSFVILMQSQLIRFLNKDIFKDTSIAAINNIRQRGRTIAYPSMLMIIGMNSLAFFLQTYVFPEKFENLIFLTMILSVWLYILGWGLLSSQMLIKLVPSKVYFGVNCFGAALSIGTSLFLIPRYLEYGFALQLLASHSLAILLQFAILKNVAKKIC